MGNRLHEVLFAFLLLGASGCAKPPQDAIERARAAIESAKQRDAGEYAPESLAAAQRAWAALQEELSAQAKKHGPARSYRQSESLATEAWAAGERAEADADLVRVQAREERLKAIDQAADALAATERMLDRALKAKQPAPGVQGLRVALDESASLLERARADIEAGRYGDAGENARSAKEKALEVAGELKAAMARQTPVRQTPEQGPKGVKRKKGAGVSIR